MKKKGIDLIDENLKDLLNKFVETTNKRKKYKLGKVVDVNDPLQKGRVRVRVYGVFSDGIPDEDLPWAVRDSGFVGGTKGSFIVPPLNAIVNVIFQDDDIYKPQYTTKVLNDDTFISDQTEDYPDSMIFFETDAGEYFKINRKTNITTYRHASGVVMRVDAEGNFTLDANDAETGNITINTPGNIEVNCGGTADVISQSDVSVKSTTGFINLGDGTTPVNNLPNCLFTGAPHYTPGSLAPGKGINVSL